MPELPEVETVCRGVSDAIAGQVVTHVRTRREGLRFPFPEKLSERMEGRRLLAVRRRAKYMIWDLEGGLSVLIHLGMSGRILIRPLPVPPPEKHDHVLFETEDAETGRKMHVTFQDPRRFGLLDLVPTDRLDRHKLLAGLGPEPLGNAFNGPALAAALKGRKTPIKVALLDQRVVAGVGNIYACEALYRAGISPRRQAATVAGARAERLAGAVREVLTEAIASGGSSLRDFIHASGELGYFQHRFAVYDHEGEFCPDCPRDGSCSGPVRRMVQAGRSTFYCPSRQR